MKKLIRRMLNLSLVMIYFVFDVSAIDYVDPCDFPQCISQLNLAIPDNGYIIVKPDMLLQNGGCPSRKYVVTATDGRGNNVNMDTLYLNSPRNINFNVKEIISGNSCTGKLTLTPTFCKNVKCKAFVNIYVPQDEALPLTANLLLSEDLCPGRDFEILTFDNGGQLLGIKELTVNTPSILDYLIRDKSTLVACNGRIQLIPFSCNSIICNDSVRVVISKDEKLYLHTDLFLEGATCSQREFAIERILNPGDIISMDFVDKNMSPLVTYRVKDKKSGNACWGNLHIEVVDCAKEFIPEFQPRNITVSCESSTHPQVIGFPVPAMALINPRPSGINAFDVKNWSPCETIQLEYSDTFENGDCTTGIDRIITRCWTAYVSGTIKRTCQKITVMAIKDRKIILPPSISINCKKSYPIDGKGNPTLEVTGMPKIEGCEEIGVVYNDQVINVSNTPCYTASKIVRNFTLVDWCTGEMTNYNQIIKLECSDDNTPPVPVCKFGVTEFSLPPFGDLNIEARSLDDGSYDDCLISGFAFSSDPSVTSKRFTIRDTGVVIKLSLFVFDLAGNNKACEVSIKVSPSKISGESNISGKVTGANLKPVDFLQGNLSFRVKNLNQEKNLINCNPPAGAKNLFFSYCLDETNFKPPYYMQPYFQDPDQNISITTFDAVLMRKMILNITPPHSQYVKLAADVNYSNSVTGLDVLLLQKYILGQASFLPRWELFAADSSQRSLVRLDKIDKLPAHDLHYIAVPTGDLNHPSVSAFRSDRLVSRQGKAIMYFTDRKLKKGEQHDIWITSEAAISLLAIQIGQKYDGAKIKVDSVYCPALPGDVHITDSEWRFLYVNPQVVPSVIRSTWIRISLTVKEDCFLSTAFNDSQYPFDLLLVRDNEEEDPIELQLRNVLANNDIGLALQKFVAQPNPFSNEVNVLIKSVVAEKAVLKIADMHGKNLFSREIQLQDQIEEMINLPEYIFESPGLYYVGLMIGNKIKYIKLVKL